MTVDPDRAQHFSEHGDRTYYFCSGHCRARFEADPARYLSPALSEPAGPPPADARWTCPMHPQIVDNRPGSCPICGMALEPMTPLAAGASDPELGDMTRRFWVGVALSLPVAMLTGDSRVTAEAVARKVGIDEVVAEVLPDQKAGVVKQTPAEWPPVAMAGDGINDAPALAQAQVGIAEGTGADAAMEAAAVTLVRGDLQGIVRARRLSRATMRNIRQNLFFAFVFNGLAIPIAAGVLYPAVGLLLNPMMASAAMSVSSVLVIANALRLRRISL